MEVPLSLLWLLVAPGVLWTGEWGRSRGPGTQRPGRVSEQETSAAPRSRGRAGGLGQRDGYCRTDTLGVFHFGIIGSYREVTGILQIFSQLSTFCLSCLVASPPCVCKT